MSTQIEGQSHKEHQAVTGYTRDFNFLLGTEQWIQYHKHVGIRRKGEICIPDFTVQWLNGQLSNEDIIRTNRPAFP
jgi:hypothetical protein